MSPDNSEHRPVGYQHRARLCVAILVLMITGAAVGSPFISAGDRVLRHDIQQLADYGIISAPVSTWPLMWGPIAADMRDARQMSDLPAHVEQSLTRLRDRAEWEMRAGELTFNAAASVAESPARIRSFDNTPRESAEISGGLSYTSDWFSVVLNGQAVDSDSVIDTHDFRPDGSALAVMLGNFSVSANTLERWWGPGWDGSLILSSNARPIPALSIDRNFTDPFQSKWLSWIGPWDLSVHFGQMESNRFVPDARFFGMRFNFKPLPSLEIGLSRTAQWCGRGRPCGFDTFSDLLIGRDNIGEGGVGLDNEPGNQMAGLDFRWAFSISGVPVAAYGQFIGEDEAGGLPSRFLGQLGVEGTGVFRQRWVYRWFGEFAGTSCQFYESSEIFRCAYNNAIYQTGYRYRGRAIGHSADSDARLLSAGLILMNDSNESWQMLLRYGALNRGNPPDSRNTVTLVNQDVGSADVSHKRRFSFGVAEIGVGYERRKISLTGSSNGDVRAFLRFSTQ